MTMLGFLKKTSFGSFGVSLAATLLASTCAASAGTLTYTDGTITGVGVSLLTPNNVSGMAGQIHLTTADGTINAWCVDVYSVFSTTGGTYDVGSSAALTGAPGVPPGLTSDQIGEMGALALHGDYLVDHPGSYSAADVAAAIQIAIWTVEYGSAFTYDALGSPIDGSPPAPSGLVAEYLSNVGSGAPWGLDSNFKVLYSGTGDVADQTLISVPEPSTWAMMLLGFAGLGFAGYRVRAKASFAKG